MSYEQYYASIVKPFFAPQPWVFGVAWGIIYPLIVAAGIALIVLLVRKHIPWSLFAVFLVNLVANLLFTPLQLALGSAPLATLDILVVLGTLVYVQWCLWRHSKTVFVLLLPYLLWGAFATILQVAILFLN